MSYSISSWISWARSTFCLHQTTVYLFHSHWGISIFIILVSAMVVGSKLQILEISPDHNLKARDPDVGSRWGCTVGSQTPPGPVLFTFLHVVSPYNNWCTFLVLYLNKRVQQSKHLMKRKPSFLKYHCPEPLGVSSSGVSKKIQWFVITFPMILAIWKHILYVPLSYPISGQTLANQFQCCWFLGLRLHSWLFIHWTW